MTAGRVSAPSNMPDEAPGLVGKREGELGVSKRISRKREARVRKERARAWERREKGREQRTRETKKMMTALSPVKKDDVVKEATVPI